MGPPEEALDAFISYASEDRNFVDAFAKSLTNFHVKIWYDKDSLQLSASLADSIPRAVADCRFGVVVLGPSYFVKKWTQEEFRLLHEREDYERRKLISPILLNVTREAAEQLWPPLVDKPAIIATGRSPEEVAIEVFKKIRPDLNAKYDPAELDAIASGRIPKDIVRGPQRVSLLQKCESLEYALREFRGSLKDFPRVQAEFEAAESAAPSGPPPLYPLPDHLDPSSSLAIYYKQLHELERRRDAASSLLNLLNRLAHDLTSAIQCMNTALDEAAPAERDAAASTDRMAALGPLLRHACARAESIASKVSEEHDLNPWWRKDWIWRWLDKELPEIHTIVEDKIHELRCWKRYDDVS
jgi:hypothetical protein